MDSEHERGVKTWHSISSVENLVEDGVERTRLFFFSIDPILLLVSVTIFITVSSKSLSQS